MDYYFILGCMGVLLSIAISLIKLDEDLKKEITLYSKLIKESEKESEKENDTDNE